MPRLTYACLLTPDVDRLGAFYHAVLQLEPSGRGTYLEFQTQPGILSVWSRDEFERRAGTVAAAGLASGSVLLEFQVDDVDAEYARLRNAEQLALEFVMPPTPLPWGIRSCYFRDPDGNLISFFSPIHE